MHLIALNDMQARTHTHTLGQTPLDKGSARCRDLYLPTQHSQETENHARGGMRAPNSNKRAAADQRFKTRSHWAR